jgi:hypothetical protein
MMTSNPTKVKPGLEREQDVEFMPGNMFLPPSLTRHSSAGLMYNHGSENFFCFTFFQKLFGWGRNKFTPMATNFLP